VRLVGNPAAKITMVRSLFLKQLARSFLSGEPTVDQIVARASRTLGKSRRWLKPVAKRYVQHFSGRTRPRLREVVEFVDNDRAFRRIWLKRSRGMRIAQWITEPQKMQPVKAAEGWNLPAIESVGVLSEWLGVNVSELEWFADLKGLTHRHPSTQLSHYHYRILNKQSGIRLIEAPKRQLKQLQTQILARILDLVPAHPAVHGFVKGRSIKSCAALHAGRRVILRMDLQDFFPSFPARRIQTMFRALGYPEPVSDLLGGICTNFAPRGLWTRENLGSISWEDRQHARDLYCRPHLPQGAPTSPALANICAYRLDCRLAGLARSCGANYTRYADDIAFSGDKAFERSVGRFSTHVAAILMEEGFTVNHRKTRIMRQGVRQHIVGLVANERPNIIRADFDRLKATLTNCIRHGAESQNREAHPHFRMHLEGRVGFVETINAAKGERLRKLFDQIRWV
jgi:RNA-directed DNA polymerase